MKTLDGKELRQNDRVVTLSDLYGTVVLVEDDARYARVLIDENQGWPSGDVQLRRLYMPLLRVVGP